MKKIIFIIAVLGTTLTSCKKDYTCTCTSTTAFDGDTDTDIYKYEIQEAKKADARAACIEATVVHKDGNYSDETVCELSS